MDNSYCCSSPEEELLDDFLISPFTRTSSLIKAITKESLFAAERKKLCRVMESLSLREHHSRTLLIHYHWDVEKLFAALEDKGKAHLLEEAGIPVLDFKHLSVPLPFSMMTCGICTLYIPSSLTTKMDCGHRFCNSCWTKHFIEQINEGQSRRMRCMAHECSTICDEAIARNLVHERCPYFAKMFDCFLLESYFHENKMVKWCPSVPHCGNAISVKGDDELCEVECSCGKQFCFSCLSEAHSPCSCAMWARWKENWDDIQTTVYLITHNTKPCPECHQLVQKDGGGNLVTCTCGQLFCWPCHCKVGRKASRHKCDPNRIDRTNNFQHSNQVCYPYTHHQNRYKAHTDALRHESAIKRITLARIEVSEPKVNEHVFSYFSWAIEEGLYTLFISRRKLLYSYPFAFYMFGGESILLKHGITKEELEIKQTLFELQQDQLEKTVEKLSDRFEELFHLYGGETIMRFQQEVTNLSSACKTLCKHMYELIETELLCSSQPDIPKIVPYSTKGIEKAMSGCDITWEENGCSTETLVANMRQFNLQ